MEVFLPYVAVTLCLLLCLYLISSFLRKRGSASETKNLPPGTRGWPFLGENIQYAYLGPQKFIKDRMDKYSPDAFQTSLFGEKMAIFCGQQGNKFLFMNENKLVTSWWPKSVGKALLSRDDKMADRKVSSKSFFHEFLKPDALKHYAPVMDAMAMEHMENEWRTSPVVKVFASSRKYTLDLACRLFLGVVDQEQIDKLINPFMLVSNGIISVPINLPGTAYNRAIKGGTMVREELIRIVKGRREEVNKEVAAEGRDCLLSKLLLATHEDGRFLSEMDIADGVFALLMASFESTSSAVTALLNYLASLPHIYEEVFKEQMEIAKSKGPGELLTWEDIEKMKFSWNVARESLRLAPPSHGAFRETTTEFSYAGFTIPKGWKTFWTVHSTHKNPKYFPEPEKFDPSRFEGSGPAPYTFVPFGGGPRMCAGKEYARLQILVFLHNVVTRFKLEKVFPDEKIVFHTWPKPVYGLPVRLQPINNE